MHLVRLMASCLVVGSAVLTVDAGEMIQGQVFEHFEPTEGWLLVGGVAAVEGERTFESVGHKPGGPTILLNGHEKDKELSYLYTVEDYGDVKLSMTFMIPANSNSGVYFMGRYEIQVRDSFGKEKVGFYDLGGVYQRWVADAPEGQRGVDGVSPSMNAAKAPGEWQQMDVVFRAPRFDSEGNKTENARFVSVHINGHLVQENVDAPGPTRAHPLRGEVAQAPIAIQGDHGPIAIASLVVEPLELD